MLLGIPTLESALELEPWWPPGLKSLHDGQSQNVLKSSCHGLKNCEFHHLEYLPLHEKVLASGWSEITFSLTTSASESLHPEARKQFTAIWLYIWECLTHSCRGTTSKHLTCIWHAFEARTPINYGFFFEGPWNRHLQSQLLHRRRFRRGMEWLGPIGWYERQWLKLRPRRDWRDQTLPSAVMCYESATDQQLTFNVLFVVFCSSSSCHDTLMCFACIWWGSFMFVLRSCSMLLPQHVSSFGQMQKVPS